MKHRVVIIGGGFGGLLTAKNLKNVDAHITLIDRSNHHLFQPLLYQVATAALSPADIATPIRSILRNYKNLEVLMAEVTKVDPKSKSVYASGHTYQYDTLVIATGSHHSYFGKDEWEVYAPGLKTVSDAVLLRKNILTAFEKAEFEDDPAKRQAYLNFVVIGGGPTGVEISGAIAELSHQALKADFRRLDQAKVQVILLEAGTRILPAFSEKNSKAAKGKLERMGVQVNTSSRVSSLNENGVTIEGREIPTKTIIWGAGNRASPAGEWLQVPVDHQGRVLVNSDLTAPSFPDVFVVGDTAAVKDGDRFLPALAPVAMQQGRYVAAMIRKRVAGESVSGKPFSYWDKGNLATVGRTFAVVEVGKFKFSGFFAWIAWVAVHIYYLIGYRNRVFVLLEWAWAYLTFRRGARLIPETAQGAFRPGAQ